MVSKELVELLEYDPAPPGSPQAITNRQTIHITVAYAWITDLKRTARIP